MDVRRGAHLRILVAAAIIALVAPAVATAQPVLTRLYTFDLSGTSGANPKAALVQGTDGNFYGTTSQAGASGGGTVFRMTPGGIVTVLHAFTGGTADGANPVAALIQATDGNFYGTTSGGGTSQYGTVFKMTPSGTLTVLHEFTGGTTDGAYPVAALIQATDGNFYGTTQSAGAGAGGTVFKMTPGGTVTVLHAFIGGTDGADPAASLIQATDGNFYGTTTQGGGSGGGTVFKMTPGGTVTLLHAFIGGTDGADPTASLIQATDGNFYGTTTQGGITSSDCPNGCGTVFRMTFAGTVTILHAFTAGVSDGADPTASLLQATDGNFYGTTASGGDCGFGTIFTMTPAGTVTLLFPYAGGMNNLAALIQATDRHLYGTTEWSAGPCTTNGGDGNVFEITLAAPMITTQPQSQTIASGTAANLSVVASGSGLSYQWYVGTAGTTTSPIAGATSSSYTTAALTSTTSYWVQISNVDGSANSATATISIAAAPTITRQPANQTVTAGQNPELAVTASGTPAPTYQWQVSTNGGSVWSNLLNTPPYGGATTTTLTVNRATTGLNGTEYRCIATNSVGSATSSAAVLSVVTSIAPGDFDSDGKSDITMYRPSSDSWYVLRSSTGYTTYGLYVWGLSGDIPVRGDFDGDGNADVAIYRPSTGAWYILQSSTGYANYVSYLWGVPGDIPEAGDYDGDGRTDVAVYRPSTGTWYVLLSSTGYVTYVSHQWGLTGDMPVPGDYGGNGRTDVAVYRPSNGYWYILQSSTNNTTYLSFVWGLSGDVPVGADYDGDGKVDPAVYRPSNGGWYFLRSSTNYATYGAYQFGGVEGDVPVPADFDGDGKTDIAVFRPSSGNWYILLSSMSYSTYVSYLWGLAGDIPLLKRP
jgi:uncharacterized repeat protein (TIGR03803 family)